MKKLLTMRFLKNLADIKDVKLMGFCNEKTSIYENIDCVINLCDTEPLRRVFLEVIDFEVPFIGIDNGGIGEIASLTRLGELMICNNSENTSEAIYEKIKLVEANKHEFVEQIRIRKNRASVIFNLKNYCKQLDSIIFNEKSF